MSSAENAKFPALADSHCFTATWTPKRNELLSWFQKEASPLAPAYESAVRLMADETFPCRIHLIAHIIRDIVNRLPGVLQKGLVSPRLEYQKHLIEIAKAWHLTENTFDEATSVPTGEPVPIPWEVARMINNLVREHRANARRPRQPELLFQVFARGDPTARASARTIRQFEEMHRWFASWAHLRDKTPPPVEKAELDRWFNVFETFLHGYVGNFFTLSGELDGDLQQANQ